jgi:NAD(P)-dependent dehydrogenase (short-subunit alcohol dehydrogenase family)
MIEDAYTFLKCDLQKSDEIEALKNHIKELHVLINNAARTDLIFKNFDELTLEEWNAGISANLTSVFFTFSIFHALLKKSERLHHQHLFHEAHTV